MKAISNTAIAAGMIIFILGACFADSPGAYGYAAMIVCMLGEFIAGAGYAVRLIGEHREEKRTGCFYGVQRKDRLDADVEFIELETKK